MNTDRIAVTEQEEEAFEVMSEQSFNDIADIFSKNRIACDGRVSCSVDDWNKVGSYIEQLEKEKTELVEMLHLTYESVRKDYKSCTMDSGLNWSVYTELLERMK